MATGLLMLLDDITTILDDVAILTKVAAKKTAGVLGDDLALNAQQVIGVDPKRELPVVWAVAKGSFINKLILVPSALLLSSVLPWLIEPLMIAGGAFLCFEGCEKLAHKFFHTTGDQEHSIGHEQNVTDESIDLVVVEKSKIKGAIRTDFILSAEIVVITLGTLVGKTFGTQVAVLSAIAIVMTVGVYGLVAGIVKLDDLGLLLLKRPSTAKLGQFILAAAPWLMKFLSIAGTAAMFLVGGGIIAHGIAPVHHLVEGLQGKAAELATGGTLAASLTGLLAHAIVGIAVGTVLVIVVTMVKKMFVTRATGDSNR